MKLYLYLLSILPIGITASPTMVHHRRTNIEPIQERVANAAGKQYGVRRINVEHEAAESSHEFGLLLGKRKSPICTEACGKVDANDCLATLAIAENAAELAGDTLFCAFKETRIFGSKCVLSFAGTDPKVEACVTNANLSVLAEEVFNECINGLNDPNNAIGGCIDSGDGSQVCLGKNICA